MIKWALTGMPTESLLILDTYDELSIARDPHGLHPDSINNLIVCVMPLSLVISSLSLDIAHSFIEQL